MQHNWVNCMCRRAFCIAVAVAWAPAAWAQRVPGRDLLEFPIGTMAEAPPLATLARDGLWNPAAVLLDPAHRARAAAAAFDGPAQQGVAAQTFSVALPISASTTVALSFLHASVRDLPHTEGDPQSVGSDIRYGTTIISASIARRLNAILDAGLSLRYRHGELDTEVRSAMALDGGIVAHIPGKGDVRIAASSFLLQPAWGGNSETRFSAAIDARALGVREDLQLRTGYALSYTGALATEHYAFLSGRVQMLEMSGGLLYSEIHGGNSFRSRLGVGLRSSTIAVGLSREANSSGIAPAYQVMITAYRKR